MHVGLVPRGIAGSCILTYKPYKQSALIFSSYISPVGNSILLNSNLHNAEYTLFLSSVQLPIYFVVSLGCYGLLMVGVGLMNFPTCPQEALLLQKVFFYTFCLLDIAMLQNYFRGLCFYSACGIWMLLDVCACDSHLLLKQLCRANHCDPIILD